jgi:hypothetical protein
MKPEKKKEENYRPIRLRNTSTKILNKTTGNGIQWIFKDKYATTCWGILQQYRMGLHQEGVKK